jgi:hypothetical protein
VKPAPTRAAAEPAAAAVVAASADASDTSASGAVMATVTEQSPILLFSVFFSLYILGEDSWTKVIHTI